MEERRIGLNNGPIVSVGNSNNNNNNNNNVDLKSEAKQLQYNSINRKIIGQQYHPQAISNHNNNNNNAVHKRTSNPLAVTSPSQPALNPYQVDPVQTRNNKKEESKLHQYAVDDEYGTDAEEIISFQNYDEYYDCDVPIVEDKGVWYNGIYFGDDDDDDNNTNNDNRLRISTSTTSRAQDPGAPQTVNIYDDDNDDNENVSETTRLLPKQHNKACPRTPVDQLERGKFYLSIIQETSNIENDDDDDE
jgi:hypothetical protein